MTNKVLLGVTSAMAMAMGIPSAFAETKMYIAGYGGSSEATFKELIFPSFEKQHNVKIIYTPGKSTDSLARLQAQRNNPEMDMAMIDDGPMMQAISYGLCDTIDQSTVDSVYPIAHFKDNKAIGMGLIATGIAYSPAYFAKKGWTKPSSWLDIANPQYKGKVTVPPITNGYGLLALVASADILGGGVDNIDPGFTFFADKVTPNVRAYEPSSGKISEMFQSGEIAMAVWGSSRVKSLADTGFSVEMIYPKEGAIPLQTALCAVKGSKNPKLTQQLIAHITSPEMQAVLAEKKSWGPVSKNVKLSPELAASLPSDPAVLKAMKKYDWNEINKYRADWTKRWTREIE